MEISATKNALYGNTNITILIIWDPVLIKSHKSHLHAATMVSSQKLQG